MYRLGLVVLMVVACGPFCLAQMSPEDAAKRLAERQAARQAERDKLVQIKQGDLNDLRAEVARLKAEVSALHQQLAEATSAAKSPPVRIAKKIEVGMSKDDLMRFIQAHHAEYQITSDIPNQPGGGERIVMTVQTMKEVVTGIHFNGVNNVLDVKKTLRPDGTLTLMLLNDAVASMDQTPGASDPDSPESVRASGLFHGQSIRR